MRTACGVRDLNDRATVQPLWLLPGPGRVWLVAHRHRAVPHRPGRVLGHALPAWHARCRMLRASRRPDRPVPDHPLVGGRRWGWSASSFCTGSSWASRRFAVIVVFQPELRRALMRLGETRLFRGWSSQVHEEIEELVESATFCSKRKIGALIAIEREVGLGGIAESGTRLNADLTAALAQHDLLAEFPAARPWRGDQPREDRLRRRAIPLGRRRRRWSASWAAATARRSGCATNPTRSCWSFPKRPATSRSPSAVCCFASSRQRRCAAC